MFYNSTGEYNECVSHGACSVSPDVSSMQEILYILFRQIAFYLVNLKSLGINKTSTVDSLIQSISLTDNVKDFTEVQILNIFSSLYNILINSKNDYVQHCKDSNIKPKYIKNLIKLTPDTNLSSLLNLGEKEFINKYKNVNSDKKYLNEILISIIKSVSANLITLKELSSDCTIASDLIISALNVMNLHISAKNIKQIIDKLAQCDIELLEDINNQREQKFGHPQKTNVSYSTVPNKAVMVSGNNFADLSNLLEFSKDTDIDIYTNGNLLIAHSYPYFNQFKNLKGHFGNDVINIMLDFATFPGAILLTKNESQNIEYLYRGRLFTTDNIVPKGVSKVDNNDFTELVNSALNAKGFAKGREKPHKTVGFDLENFKKDFENLLNKNPGKIHLFGFSDLRPQNISDFKRFFNNMNDDEIAVSFSYNPGKDNVLHINLAYDYALLHKISRYIFEKVPINSDNLYLYFTKCDYNSLSNIIYLKNKGAKNIYLSACQPNIINPAVLNIFKKIYNIDSLQ